MRKLAIPFLCLVMASAAVGCKPSIPRPNLEKAWQAAKDSDLDTLKAEKVELEGQLAFKDAQIKAKVQQNRRAKLGVVSGGAFFLFALCVVAFFAIPGCRKLVVSFGLGFLAVGVLALLAAWLVKYLAIILALFALAFVGAVIWWWRMDSKSRDQIVKGVRKIKGQVPDFAEKMGWEMDVDVDLWTDRTRKRLT